MKALSLALSALTAVMAGCAIPFTPTPFRPPPDVAHIQLVRGDSPTVIVEKIWLERKGGPLVVTGYVVKRLSAEDTTGTHLDVSLYDAHGNKLRTTVERFTPQQLVRRGKRPPFGTYRIVLDPLPPNTTHVEVTAHDAPH